jgi:hypothetical protein
MFYSTISHQLFKENNSAVCASVSPQQFDIFDIA